VCVCGWCVVCVCVCRCVCVWCVWCVQCVQCLQSVRSVCAVCAVCALSYQLIGRPAMCHIELLRLGLVQGEVLAMFLLNSQRCFLPTWKTLMTSVI